MYPELHSGPKGYGFGGSLTETGLKGKGEKEDYSKTEKTREKAKAAEAPRRSTFLSSSKPGNATPYASGAGNSCAKCKKTVGFAEKVSALGEAWHKQCFTCEECNKTLNTSNFSDKGGHVYCNGCHSKLHGPKGFGFGGAVGHST